MYLPEQMMTKIYDFIWHLQAKMSTCSRPITVRHIDVNAHGYLCGASSQKPASTRPCSKPQGTQLSTKDQNPAGGGRIF